MKIRNSLSNTIIYVPIGSEHVVREYLEEHKRYDVAINMLDEGLIPLSDAQFLFTRVTLLAAKIISVNSRFFASNYWELYED
jgi:hypothetical protein